MSLFKKLTAADIANILEEADDLIDPTFFIDPPENTNISDGDTDDEDPTGDINHLSGNQLRAGGELVARKITDDGIVEIRLNNEDDDNNYESRINEKEVLHKDEEEKGELHQSENVQKDVIFENICINNKEEVLHEDKLENEEPHQSENIQKDVVLENICLDEREEVVNKSKGKLVKKPKNENKNQAGNKKPLKRKHKASEGKKPVEKKKKFTDEENEEPHQSENIQKDVVLENICLDEREEVVNKSKGKLVKKPKNENKNQAGNKKPLKRKHKASEGKKPVEKKKKFTDEKNVKNKKPKKKKVILRNWEEKDIPDRSVVEFSRAGFLKNDYSPVNMFEFFFDEDVVDYIVQCTNQYALEKGNVMFTTTKEEIRLFFAILFFSGYNILPRTRMYWEVAEDVHNETLSQAMSRNRFEDILRYLHFSENSKQDLSDKFSKVRPVMCMLNERWLQYFPGDVYLSVDESMVPYFGRYGAKQHIHGKPIRFGYKVWILATRLGYCVQAEPYQGKGSLKTIPELGVGGSVVVDLISELPKDRKYCLFFDNFFTSFKLLEELKKRGHDGTGTVRADRIQNAPLPEVKEVKKEARGTLYQITDKDTNITLVRYKDNNVFTMASTVTGVHPMGKAKRWSNSDKKHIFVPQPSSVTLYNMNMGGVDRLDENVASYRINIRNKKWYWPMISYLLNVSMNNAWLLYRMTPKGIEDKLDQLGFIRYIVRCYLTLYKVDRPTAGRPSMKVSSRVLPEVRYSKVPHHLETVEKQVRCAQCGKATRKKCKICQVGCHILCAEAFHTST